MLIKPSAALRNEYNSISALAKETGDPIYITLNGEGDLVLMSIEAFEKREVMLGIREKLQESEFRMLHGEKTISLNEAEKRIRNRLNGEI